MKCKCLTSLTLALGRLKIKDENIWELLEHHLIRLKHNIEPMGFAYAIKYFTKLERNNQKLYEVFEEECTRHMRKMNGFDLNNFIEGMSVSLSDSPRWNTHLM